MGKNVPDFIKEETRKRCAIQAFDDSVAKKMAFISPEMFHLFYEARSIGFSLYIRVETVLVEYMRSDEYSHHLLDQMKLAMVSDHRVELMILKSQHRFYEQLVNDIRAAKLKALTEKDPALDQRSIDVFTNLSNASQLIVRGGISEEVAGQIKSSASYLVSNLMGNEFAIATLSRMVTHDPTLYDHSASVAMISGLIALQCLPEPLSKKDSELVTQCGLYHDVGKTCVPSVILNKPGKFTDEEFAIMKSHAELGEQELQKIIKNGTNINEVVARVAGEHHERFGGRGYPRGRSGRLESDPVNGIHLYSRIVTIADVYSALLMKRIYKPAYEAQDAIKIMAGVAKEEYDPIIFKGFLLSVVKSLNLYQDKIHGKDKGRILSFDSEGKLTENKRLLI
jgi:putative nucleotidyltransferase with HDIG domain